MKLQPTEKHEQSETLNRTTVRANDHVRPLNKQ